MARATANSRGGYQRNPEIVTEFSRISETFGEVRQAEDPAQITRTARRIAYFLVGALVFTLVGHYTLVAVLGLIGGEGDTIESLGNVFAAWFPLIAGLTGGVVTYFLTRSD